MMADERSLEAARAALTKHLEQRGMRRTSERFAVLDCVMGLTDHFSVDTLLQHLNTGPVKVSRATAYNTVDLLVDAGLLRRHTFGAQPARYERVSGIGAHHHLVCSQCGKVREVKDAEIDSVLATRRYAAFHPAYADLYIYGTCSRCARKKRKKQ